MCTGVFPVLEPLLKIQVLGEMDAGHGTLLALNLPNQSAVLSAVSAALLA